MEEKTMILKVDLSCTSCSKKMEKIFGKHKDEWNIKEIKWDEKKGEIKLVGCFNPEKLKKKLCCKACRIIIDFIICPPPPPPQTPPPVCVTCEISICGSCHKKKLPCSCDCNSGGHGLCCCKDRHSDCCGCISGCGSRCCCGYGCRPPPIYGGQTTQLTQIISVEDTPYTCNMM